MVSDNCLSDRELQNLLEVDVVHDCSRHEDHIATCVVCRQRLESLAGSAISPPAVTETHDLASPALTRVIRDLCRIRLNSRDDGSGAWSPEDIGTGDFTYLSKSSQPNSLGRLGKYEIVRVIGQGGMGTVFLATDPALSRHVAIKVPTPSLVATRETHDRFVREARALASVKHDHIVTIHAVEESGGLPFMVMEYVEGESLAQSLASGKQLNVDDVIRIAGEIADAVAAAHARGLVHRDIKPANILLEGTSRRVKVTDFGLAKSATDTSLTASGIVAGTPEYMSPEQASDEKVTARSDLFSLGVVLYAALAGESPFRGKNALSTLRRICSENPQPLSVLNEDVPDWLDQLIRQLLSKRPADRPRSASEVQQRLRQRGSSSAPRDDALPAGPEPESFAPLASPTRQKTTASQQKTAADSMRSMDTRDRRAIASATPSRLTQATKDWRSSRAVWGLGAVIACLTVGLVGAYWPRSRQPTDVDASSETVVSASLPDSNIGNQRAGFYVGSGAEPFADLKSAMASAADGDVIRIVGNGPYAVPGYDLNDKRITIRAAEGSSPIFLSRSPEVPNDQSFLRSQSDLTLQGLEVHWQARPIAGSSTDAQSQMCIVSVTGGSLTLSRCRLVGSRMTRCAGVLGGSLRLDGCEFVTQSAPCLVWDPAEKARLDARNCVFQGRVALLCDALSNAGTLGHVTVNLTENTFSTERAVQLLVGQPRMGFDFQAEHNIFDVDDLVVLAPQNHLRQLRRPANSAQTRMLVKSLLEWKDSANVYRRQMSFVSRGLLRFEDPARRDVESLTDWLTIWNTGAGTTSIAADFDYEAADGTRLLTPRIINTDSTRPLTTERLGADSSRVGPKIGGK